MFKFKKIKSSKKLLSLLFAGGIFLIFAAGGILAADKLFNKNNPEKAKAAATSYGSTWSIPAGGWRNTTLRNFDSGWNMQTSLGPAGWSVGGSAGTASFTETWVAGGWQEGNSICEYFDSKTDIWKQCSNSQKNTFSPGDFSGLSSFSGLYAGMYVENQAMRSQFYSVPTVWTVTGTLTQP